MVRAWLRIRNAVAGSGFPLVVGLPHVTVAAEAGGLSDTASSEGTCFAFSSSWLWCRKRQVA
jgi:hypothetical protein